MKAKRWERLTHIVGMLRSGRRYTADKLAAELGVSRRAIYRDLAALRLAGAEVRFDPAGRSYTIRSIAHLPPINLSADEALAILFLTRKVMDKWAIPDVEAATNAALKIESLLPAEILDDAGTILDAVEVRPSPQGDHEGVLPTLRRLQQAVAERRVVRMHYDSYYDRREIDVAVLPYRLVFINRAWYVIGYSKAHTQVRTFKLERIVGLTVSNERFTSAPKFSLDDHFGNAWSMIRGRRRHQVRVRFTPKVAGNVDEIRWHKTQQTRRLPDGSLIFTAEVDGIDEVSWWVLGYGDQAVVEQPAELRELIARRARAMVHLYDGKSK